MDSQLHVRMELVPSGRMHMTVAGELDLGVASHFDDLAGLVVAAGATVVELDLADVTFIDVSGSRALSCFSERLEMHGVDVVHGACSRVVIRLRELLAGQGAGRNLFDAAAAETGADMMMLSETRS
jgi:anti-anti-sigma regulatory factor